MVVVVLLVPLPRLLVQLLLLMVVVLLLPSPSVVRGKRAFQAVVESVDSSCLPTRLRQRCPTAVASCARTNITQFTGRRAS